MNKVVSIERIHSISVHRNADKLLCAKILEWPVVIKKDDGFKDGDLVVFVSIDTVVDSTNPFFAFMEKQKFRTWNARFRGEPSSGLVCPLSLVLDKGLKAEECVEGLEVSELLNCKHYEKPLDIRLSGQARGNFPTNIISITDEKNLLSYPRVVDEFKGLSCYITVKQDGSSCTIIRNNEDKQVCSRRLSLKEGESAFWTIAKKYDILNQLDNMNFNLALQGEICGPKMNGNKLELPELDFFLFNVMELNTREYAGLAGVEEAARMLNIKTVPILLRFRWDDTWNIERLREIANNITYPNGKPGEGIVIRPVLSRYSETLKGMMSVKIINQNYKNE